MILAIECLKLQVIFRKRATKYRALLRKMTCKDKASYGSWPPCTMLNKFSNILTFLIKYKDISNISDFEYCWHLLWYLWIFSHILSNSWIWQTNGIHIYMYYLAYVIFKITYIPFLYLLLHSWIHIFNQILEFDKKMEYTYIFIIVHMLSSR